MPLLRGLLERARALLASGDRRAALTGASDAEAVRLVDVERVLSYYLRGLWDLPVRIGPTEDLARPRGFLGWRGRKIEAHDAPYSDGSVLYLPPTIELFPSRAENFALYKGMAALCAAQLLHGSLSYVRWFMPSAEKRLALDLFTMLENARLEDLLGRELAGLGEELRARRRMAWARRPDPAGASAQEILVEGLLQHLLVGVTREELPPTAKEGGLAVSTRSAVEDLAAAVAGRPPETASDSARLALDLAGRLEALAGPYRGCPPVPHWPRIRPERVVAAQTETQGEQRVTPGRNPGPRRGDARPASERTRPTRRTGGGFPLGGDLPRDPTGASASPDERAREGSGGQERRTVGAQVPERLTRVRLAETRRPSPRAVTLEGWEAKASRDAADQVFVYDEWDYRVASYRHGVCVLSHAPLPVRWETEEPPALEVDDGLAHRVQRQLQLLRGERRWQKRQLDGEEVDLDATVESIVDRHASGASPERLYRARGERIRDVAAAFLVDLSASTETWVKGERRVVDVERQALLLMSAALETLGDAYAIFGFSSRAERGCAFYRIKGFAESFGGPVEARIEALSGRGYTRMGGPIRHASRILGETGARLKLLLILSDGKPNEVGIYQGTYAVEDTRRAVLEARERRIVAFGVTVDRGDRSYLARIFGPRGYAVIDDVAELPARMAAVYRQLTC